MTERCVWDTCLCYDSTDRCHHVSYNFCCHLTHFVTKTTRLPTSYENLSGVGRWGGKRMNCVMNSGWVALSSLFRNMMLPLYYMYAQSLLRPSYLLLICMCLFVFRTILYPNLYMYMYDENILLASDLRRPRSCPLFSARLARRLWWRSTRSGRRRDWSATSVSRAATVDAIRAVYNAVATGELIHIELNIDRILSVFQLCRHLQ